MFIYQHHFCYLSSFILHVNTFFVSRFSIFQTKKKFCRVKLMHARKVKENRMKMVSVRRFNYPDFPSFKVIVIKSQQRENNRYKNIYAAKWIKFWINLIFDVQKNEKWIFHVLCVIKKHKKIIMSKFLPLKFLAADNNNNNVLAFWLSLWKSSVVLIYIKWEYNISL